MILDKLASTDHEAIRARIFSQFPQDSGIPVKLACCGGGAESFKRNIQNFSPDIQISVFDELECVGTGLNFIESIVNQSATNSAMGLIVNIGTGISIIKKYSTRIVSRIGGSSIGGGTFSGLARLALYDAGIDPVTIIPAGNPDNVDILVKDIYPDSAAGLDGNLIAASLGKIKCMSGDTFAADFCAGVARAVCINAAQLAYLYARLEGITHVTFTGGFLENLQNQREITNSMKYWSLDYGISSKISNFPAFVGCLGSL